MYFSRQRGIALIQILLLTGVLSVLALYVTQTASSQVAQARLANDKVEALVSIHSAESLLLFELFTQTKSLPQFNENKDANTIKGRWNFYAKPFTIGQNVVVKMQDQAALINLHYPNIDLLKRLLSAKTSSQSQVETIVDSFLDWQDVDDTRRVNGAEKTEYGGELAIRNGSIPSIYDIEHIKYMAPDIQHLFIANGTIYTAGALSVFNTTKELLTLLTNTSAAQQVVELRESGNITADLFKQITGIEESDNMFYYTSTFLKIELQRQIGESVARKKMVIQLQPYVEGDGRPYNLYKSW